jgi:hypothetical protein
VYSFADAPGDTSLTSFSTAKANNIMTVAKDILAVNKNIKIHLVPWSPVGIHLHMLDCVLTRYEYLAPIDENH